MRSALNRRCSPRPRPGGWTKTERSRSKGSCPIWLRAPSEAASGRRGRHHWGGVQGGIDEIDADGRLLAGVGQRDNPATLDRRRSSYLSGSQNQARGYLAGDTECVAVRRGWGQELCLGQRAEGGAWICGRPAGGGGTGSPFGTSGVQLVRTIPNDHDLRRAGPFRSNRFRKAIRRVEGARDVEFECVGRNVALERVAVQALHRLGRACERRCSPSRRFVDSFRGSVAAT